MAANNKVLDNQESESQLLIDDIKEKYFWGIQLRYLIVAVSLLPFILSFYNSIFAGVNIRLISFVAAYNFLAHLLYLFKKKYKLWQMIFIKSVFQLLDILAITLLIYTTGFMDSPYWFLYLVLIIVSGFGMFFYYSISVFLIAFFSVLFYLGMFWLAYNQILPIYAPNFNIPPAEFLNLISNKAIFAAASFFLFAATIYYFSKLLSEQRQALSQKNRQLLGALEEMKDVDHMKDEFVSIASHELRTPLSIVRENISLIEDGIVGPVEGKQLELLSTSIENVDRLSKIIDNLLDISKIDSHSLNLNRKRADVSRIARRAIEILKKKAGEKNIYLGIRWRDKAMALIDADQIYRVFLNLIDNAIKYTPNNGKVWVIVEDSGFEVKSYVCDNGPGIAAGDLPKVFERFMRFSSTDKAFISGTGLGLSICKGIIEMHRGQITVESEIGVGTKFIFVLPKGEKNGQ
jgi:signal transduction histidine kinase